MKQLKWLSPKIMFFCLLIPLACFTSIVEAAPSASQTLPATFLHEFRLMLDPAQPIEEILPPLFKTLVQLKAEGLVKHFDHLPEEHTLRVMAPPAASTRLSLLPGVVGVTTSPMSPALESEPIQALASGHITGTVTYNSSPVKGFYVDAYRYNGSQWVRVGDTVLTNADGTYDISGLETGTYRVRFWHWKDTYLGECYDNALIIEDATDIHVTDGATTSNINAQLALPGHITGTITNGTSPLPNIDVIVYRYYDTYGVWAPIKFGTTTSSGTYDVGGLDTGTYRVEFMDSEHDYVGEYYNDKPTLESANDVAVTAGSTTPNINAVLAPTGHITGTVTDDTSPLPNIKVSVYRYNGSSWEMVNSALTDSNGYYDVKGFGTGTYRVEFMDWATATYATEYYNNKPTLGNANDVAVTSGSTTSNINAELALAGRIIGIVTDGTNPLSGIKVTVYRYNGSEWEEMDSGSTSSSGNYNIRRLGAGAYRVKFWDKYDGNYATQYYNDAPTLDSANDVMVTAGNTTSHIDASLKDAYKVYLPIIRK